LTNEQLKELLEQLDESASVLIEGSSTYVSWGYRAPGLPVAVTLTSSRRIWTFTEDEIESAAYSAGTGTWADRVSRAVRVLRAFCPPPRLQTPVEKS
jgi:hypothetical protein